MGNIRSGRWRKYRKKEIVENAYILDISIFGFDHGVGHSLLLLYDAKVPLGKNSNYFNGL
jgi:hypothetical protein